MAKRVFEVTVSRTVRMCVDEAVIAQGLSDDNPIQGPGATEQQIIEHLAFNLAGNCLSLSQIDGYANRDDSEANVEWEPWDVEFRALPSKAETPKRPRGKRSKAA
jgi:hypothetical protein